MPPALPPFPTHLGPITGTLETNGQTYLVTYSLAESDLDPIRWIKQYRAQFRADLRRYGAILLRHLPVRPEVFEAVVATIGRIPQLNPQLTTPRPHARGNPHTSTEYPADQRIPLHNKDSNIDNWPALLFFLCETAAASGGETLLADSRAVFQMMPAKIRGRFAPGVSYSHVYRPDLGLSWQDAFQTDSQALVESYCLQHSHEFEWDGPILRTRYRQPAWRFTPEPRCPVWFNQAHLYHPASRDLLQAPPTATLERDFPDNVLLSDGTQISEEDIATINRVYADCALPISWRPGDLLMVDNMLTAHGRMPYTGNHRMLVRMA